VAESAVAGSLKSADGTKLAYRSWPKPGAATTFYRIGGGS